MIKRDPVRKHGRWIFGALVVGVCAAILATLLLANDSRNLRALLQHYQLAWPFDWPAASQPASDVKRARSLPQSAVVSLPAKLTAAVWLDPPGGLARAIRMRGPVVCDRLAEGGVETKGWAISAYDPQSFECLSEQRVNDADGLGGFASYFLSIRGSPEGEISAIRMKLVTPETVAGAAMKVKFLQALNIVIDASGWQDFGPVIASATRLEDFEATDFGISLGFKREFTNPRRFNLVILPTNAEPAVKRTRDFFEDRRWLPIPAALGSLPRLEPLVSPEKSR